ncbi:hypothetical protein AAMO2058_001713100 [Amorphochlora amoebiformis]
MKRDLIQTQPIIYYISFRSDTNPTNNILHKLQKYLEHRKKIPYNPDPPEHDSKKSQVVDKKSNSALKQRKEPLNTQTSSEAPPLSFSELLGTSQSQSNPFAVLGNF